MAALPGSEQRIRLCTAAQDILQLPLQKAATPLEINPLSVAARWVTRDRPCHARNWTFPKRASWVRCQ